MSESVNPQEPDRSERSLRDRIAAAIERRYTDEAVGHTYEVCLMAADAVIAELGAIPDRQFVDDQGRRWEYPR